MLLWLKTLFNSAANPEFIIEPSSTTLTVNQIVQFKCTAYVSTLYSDLNVVWSDLSSGLTPSENDGFIYYNETIEASGIILVTTVLTFSGSTQPASHSLSCTASVLSVSISKHFTISVVDETGMPFNMQE